MKFLNFGSLNIDYVYKMDHFVEKGETAFSESLNVFPGGKGLNQSIAMGRAGLSVFHAGNIGHDGRFLLELLKKSGVDVSLVSVRDEIRTGNAIIQNDRNGENCIIVYGGANQAVTKEQVHQVLSGFDNGDYLILQNEINELDDIVEEAYKKGMVIVLNPSPINQKIQKLNLQHIHWFLLNEIEASQLTGRKAEDREDLAESLAKQFPMAGVILTLGEKGSCCILQGESIWQKSYPVQTVDTTAAGDTFTGYFLAGLVQGRGVRDSMKLASMAAALAVSKMGAEPSIPWIEQVEDALKNT